MVLYGRFPISFFCIFFLLHLFLVLCAIVVVCVFAFFLVWRTFNFIQWWAWSNFTFPSSIYWVQWSIVNESIVSDTGYQNQQQWHLQSFGLYTIVKLLFSIKPAKMLHEWVGWRSQVNGAISFALALKEHLHCRLWRVLFM